MTNMRAQAERFGAEMVDDDIVAVDLTGDVKTVTDTAGTVHRAKTVIVATGSGYRKLGLPKEDELSGRGGRHGRPSGGSSLPGARPMGTRARADPERRAPVGGAWGPRLLPFQVLS
jgi:glycine/D-amino acid oxidase-like deaminating enzyme